MSLVNRKASKLGKLQFGKLLLRMSKFLSDAGDECMGEVRTTPVKQTEFVYKKKSPRKSRHRSRSRGTFRPTPNEGARRVLFPPRGGITMTLVWPSESIRGDDSLPWADRLPANARLWKFPKTKSNGRISPRELYSWLMRAMEEAERLVLPPPLVIALLKLYSAPELRHWIGQWWEQSGQDLDMVVYNVERQYEVSGTSAMALTTCFNMVKGTKESLRDFVFRVMWTTRAAYPAPTAVDVKRAMELTREIVIRSLSAQEKNEYKAVEEERGAAGRKGWPISMNPIRTIEELAQRAAKKSPQDSPLGAIREAHGQVGRNETPTGITEAKRTDLQPGWTAEEAPKPPLPTKPISSTDDLWEPYRNGPSYQDQLERALKDFQARGIIAKDVKRHRSGHLEKIDCPSVDDEMPELEEVQYSTQVQAVKKSEKMEEDTRTMEERFQDLIKQPSYLFPKGPIYNPFWGERARDVITVSKSPSKPDFGFTPWVFTKADHLELEGKEQVYLPADRAREVETALVKECERRRERSVAEVKAAVGIPRSSSPTSSSHTYEEVEVAEASAAQEWKDKVSCTKCGIDGHILTEVACPLFGHPLTPPCRACHKGLHAEARCPRKNMVYPEEEPEVKSAWV